MTAPTLTEFLLARIADDEQQARGDIYEERWLAECEAKRRIVEGHKPLREVLPVEDMTYHEAADTCVTCGPGDHWSVRDLPDEWKSGWCATLGALASIYADHPDYRDEWRP